MQQRISKQQRTDCGSKVVSIIGFVGDGGGIERRTQVVGGWIVLPIEVAGTADVGVVSRQTTAVHAGLMAVPRHMAEEDNGAQMER